MRLPNLTELAPERSADGPGGAAGTNVVGIEGRGLIGCLGDVQVAALDQARAAEAMGKIG